MSEEKEPQLVVSIYDTIRNEALLTANKEAVNGKLKEEELKAAEADYLSPFLVNVVG